MFRSLYGASKAERLAARAQRLKLHAGARLVPGPAGCAVYTYERGGKYLALFFIGSSAKPACHYAYSTIEKRADAISQFHADMKNRADRKVRERVEQKAKGHTFKVGDIVNTSWGYDQTNVDFYAVTRVSRACVWVRKILQDGEATGFMQERVWPKMPIEMVGEESRHVATRGGFSIDGHGASLTTGDTYASHYA